MIATTTANSGREVNTIVISCISRLSCLLISLSCYSIFIVYRKGSEGQQLGVLAEAVPSFDAG